MLARAPREIAAQVVLFIGGFISIGMCTHKQFLCRVVRPDAGELLGVERPLQQANVNVASPSMQMLKGIEHQSIRVDPSSGVKIKPFISTVNAHHLLEST